MRREPGRGTSAAGRGGQARGGGGRERFAGDSGRRAAGASAARVAHALLAGPPGLHSRRSPPRPRRDGVVAAPLLLKPTGSSVGTTQARAL